MYSHALMALRMDPELRQWAIEGLKKWLGEDRMFMKTHEKTLEALEMTAELDLNKLLSHLRWHGYQSIILGLDFRPMATYIFGF